MEIKKTDWKFFKWLTGIGFIVMLVVYVLDVITHFSDFGLGRALLGAIPDGIPHGPWIAIFLLVCFIWLMKKK